MKKNSRLRRTYDGLENQRFSNPRKFSIFDGFHLYTFGILRKLYNWTLSWANTKYGIIALFAIAFAESSFFPIPPDILLIALCLSLPTRAFWYALICSIGSILGGMFGYIIGFGLYNTIGARIIDALGYQQYFNAVGNLFAENAFLAILGAAFTPIPYKVFTIAAGFWKINLITFISASIIGRSARFFLVAGLIYYFGEKIKSLIDKYFNVLTIMFFALLVLGFVVIKYLI